MEKRRYGFSLKKLYQIMLFHELDPYHISFSFVFLQDYE